MNALLPDPLHPAVVHLPIALAVLLPFFAIGALWVGRATPTAWRSWAVVAALLGALAATSWYATETGEEQEEVVEAVVPEAAFETHEERADKFLTLSVVVLGIGLIGFVPGIGGLVARVAATAGTAALVVAGYGVGHSGGELVYKHGAASAYVTPAPAVPGKEHEGS
jgi:uncharacterized membrane protein